MKTGKTVEPKTEPAPAPSPVEHAYLVKRAEDAALGYQLWRVFLQGGRELSRERVNQANWKAYVLGYVADAVEADIA